MSYPIDTTIPNAPNNPANDQPKMKDNFANISSFLQVNHVTPGAANNGKHKFVEMPNGGLPAGLNGGESTIYSKAASGSANVFFTPGNSGNEYQLTRAIGASFGSFAAGNPGWSFLPGGILIQWGTNTSASGSTINYPVTFTSAVFSIQCTNFQNTTNRHFVYVRSTTLSGFVTTQLDSGGSGETNTFTWLAIGI